MGEDSIREERCCEHLARHPIRQKQVCGGVVCGGEAGLVTFLPAGGIEVTVDEDSANGTLVFDQTVRTPDGSMVGLNAQVDGGRVASFSVKGPRRPFRKYLESDVNAGRLSFFGVGL